MMEMIEIHIVFPKKLKILVPKQLLEELEQRVEEEKLTAVITEALIEQLKKIRFRKDLEKARTKVA